MLQNATNKIIHSHSPEQTFQIGTKLGKTLKKGDLILLTGNLGSGKTCFVQGLAKGMGINQRINSPTYVYIHPYKRKTGHFYHIDLYRVETVEKLKMIGVEDLLFDGQTIVAVEWPDLLIKHYDCLPFRRIIHVTLERETEQERKISIITSS